MKLPFNPFSNGLNAPQYVRWQDFQENTPYHFELILPLKAVVQAWKNKGAYLVVAAISLSPAPTMNSEIVPNTKFLINFPVRTLERAYLAISTTFRKSMTDTDNLVLKFSKPSKESLLIKHYERLASTPEQQLFANEQYSTIKQYDVERSQREK